MYTIYIRASCKIKNGLGHVMRCINLSDKFIKNNFKVVFLIDNNDAVIDLLTYKDYRYEIVNNKSFNYNIKYRLYKHKYFRLSYNFDYIFKYKDNNNYIFNHYLSTYSPLFNELNKIRNIIKSKDESIILTDSYWMSNNYLISLKSLCKYLVSIDDINFYDYPSDIVINNNVYACDLNFNYDKNTKYLLGPKYVILKSEFEKNHNFIVTKDVKNILITMGGSDVNTFTSTLIDYLKDIDNTTLNVIVGPGFKNINHLYDTYLSIPNINLIYNPANMKDVMCKNDIAISSASTTSYELASIGIPTILSIQADNQVMLAKKMNKIGAMINSGWFYEINEDFKYKVIDFINSYELRINMSQVCKALVSKNGALDIVNEVKLYIN